MPPLGEVQACDCTFAQCTYKCLVDCLQNLSLEYCDSRGNGNENLAQSIIGLV